MTTDAQIAGALFDFVGWLTTRPERLTISSRHNVVPVIDALREWATMRGFNLDEANVAGWQMPTEAVGSDPLYLTTLQRSALEWARHHARYRADSATEPGVRRVLERHESVIRAMLGEHKDEAVPLVNGSLANGS